MLRQSLLFGSIASTRIQRSLLIPASLKPSLIVTKTYDIRSCNFSVPTRPDSKKTVQNTLSNEKLVNVLMRKNKAVTAEDIQVRLVVPDEGKSTSTVVSLLEAIKTASDLELDLIGVSVDQNPPVLKIVSMDKLFYKFKKNTSSSSNLPVKQVQFTAAIAGNDFSRKVNEVLKYLEKGHSCLLKVRSSRFSRRLDGECVPQLIDQLKEAVADRADIGTIKLDEEKRFASVNISPKSTKK